MIKIKKGFVLRKLGTEYIAVAIGAASRDFNGMIRLNETGAFYWEELSKGRTEEQLVEETRNHFEEVDEETVRKDIREFLESISIALDYDTTND